MEIRIALGSIHPSIQLTLKFQSLRVKQVEQEADHSLSISVEVTKECSLSSKPLTCPCGIVLRQRGYLTFSLQE
jgi:hypothetical protein